MKLLVLNTLKFQNLEVWQVSGGSKEARGTPHVDPNSFNFMQFLGKFCKIVCWHPPGGLAPPPQGGPASATARVLNYVGIQDTDWCAKIHFPNASREPLTQTWIGTQTEDWPLVQLSIRIVEVSRKKLITTENKN